MDTISFPRWRILFYVTMALVLVGTVTFRGGIITSSSSTATPQPLLRSLFQRGLEEMMDMMDMADDEFGLSEDDDDSVGNSTETVVGDDNALQQALVTPPPTIGEAVAFEVGDETFPVVPAEQVDTQVPTTTTTMGTAAPVQGPSKPPRTRTTKAPSEPTSLPVQPPAASPVPEPIVAILDPPTKPPRKPTASPITTQPTAAPAVHSPTTDDAVPVGEAEVYSPADDDPISDKDFEIVEEVESQLAKQEKVARTAGGFGFVLAICAMIFTAHQMSENPDGIFARYVRACVALFVCSFCVVVLLGRRPYLILTWNKFVGLFSCHIDGCFLPHSICRLAITLASVVVKIICMPCRKVIGTGHPHYTGHMPISSNDYRYRGQDAGGFEMS
jgi:hypothetical protein